MDGENISRKMAMLRAKAIVRSLQAIGLDQAFKNCGLKISKKVMQIGTGSSNYVLVQTFMFIQEDPFSTCPSCW